MSKILFGISAIGLIFSSVFVIVSIWNNVDWQLLERGYYTFGTLTIAIATYLAIQQVPKLENASNLDRFNMVISALFAVVTVIFIAVSVYNTKWELLEKGYYWLGTGFVLITSAMVASTINSVFDTQEYDNDKVNKPSV